MKFLSAATETFFNINGVSINVKIVSAVQIMLVDLELLSGYPGHSDSLSEERKRYSLSAHPADIYSVCNSLDIVRKVEVRKINYVIYLFVYRKRITIL